MQHEKEQEQEPISATRLDYYCQWYLQREILRSKQHETLSLLIAWGTVKCQCCLKLYTPDLIPATQHSSLWTG